MRKWLFILYFVWLLYLFIVDPLWSVAFLPSVLLFYWVWRDGEEIKKLREEVEYLRDVKTKKSR